MNKSPNFGFVVISPEHNFGRLKSTIASMRNYYSGVDIICTVGRETPADAIKDAEALCPIHKGKDTITSLINTGIKKGHKEWNLIIMEGAIVRSGLIKRYSNFIESETDILFPIAVEYDIQGKPTNLRADFISATLNGIFIHQKTFKTIGNLSDNPLEVSKLMWGLDAIKNQCKFKAILGCKMC